ncbi:hypothetical protein ACFVT5_31745 [Streptomyces sp. NPDC058001]|uniref:hypothetical protein n=1 Tax=Streptomyces sp. NPDC058001 TaxID=3346300 RepID=UPI0036E168A1
MDQGVAAVWAAGVAGFASAAGVVVGAGLAGRSAQRQVTAQGSVDSARRVEDHRRQGYARFHERMNEAILAIDEWERAIRHPAAPPSADAESAGHTTWHAAFACTFEIRTCGPAEAADFANWVCMALRESRLALAGLRSAPDAITDPDSPASRAWEESGLRVTSWYAMFSDATRRAVNEAGAQGR